MLLAPCSSPPPSADVSRSSVALRAAALRGCERPWLRPRIPSSGGCSGARDLRLRPRVRGPAPALAADILRLRGASSSAEVPPAPSLCDRSGITQPRYGPAWSAPRREPRGQLGIVLMPGTTTSIEARRATARARSRWSCAAFSGGARLRLGFEYTRFTRVADVALKYDFRDRESCAPFSRSEWEARGSSGPISSGRGTPPEASRPGSDLYLNRDFFVTFEAKQRAFTHDTPTGLEVSAIHQTSLFVGAGFYF